MRGRYLALLIAVSTAFHLFVAAELGLGHDEAYHALYAANPQLGYYDHPPMLALVEWVGLTLWGDPYSVVGLRFGFVLLFAGSTWLLARITARVYGDRAALFAALTLNVSGYYGLAASTFALPDGPLLFFWLLTLDRLGAALDEPGSIRRWIEAGLACGGAMLSKYHGVLLPLGMALFLALDRPMRHLWRRPGPYIAGAVALLVFAPVLVWNARHGWASFLFQGSRAVGPPIPRPDRLAAALGSQAMYLFPWIWVPLVLILVRAWRRWRDITLPIERLWVCVATVPVAVFTLVAGMRPVLPHWGLIGLVPLLPILGRDAVVLLDRDPRWRRRWAFAVGFPIVLALVTIVEARTGWLQHGGGSPVGLFTEHTDPTAEFSGWDQVADRLEQLGALEAPGTFVFTSRWYDSGHVAHAIRGRAPVLCYSATDPRGFAYWSEPSDWVGRDGILVSINHNATEPSFFEPWFRRIEPLASFEVLRAGIPIRHVRLFRCVDQVQPFPFRAQSLAEAQRARRRAIETRRQLLRGPAGSSAP